jgi:hypothetical protein
MRLIAWRAPQIEAQEGQHVYKGSGGQGGTSVEDSQAGASRDELPPAPPLFPVEGRAGPGHAEHLCADRSHSSGGTSGAPQVGAPQMRY